MKNNKKPLGLLIAAVMLLSGTQLASAQYTKKSNIVDTAVAAGSFDTLVAALAAADLVEALKGDGPFTVFAPTDAAFAALPEGTVEMLLKPENKAKLASILTYHVVSGNVKAKKAMKLSAAQTLNGQRVDIKVENGHVMIDGATVTSADVAASNGTIHVIDQVIMPTSDTIPAVADKAGSFATLLAAVKAAGLADVLSGEGPFTVFAPTDAAFAALPEGTVESLLKPENLEQLQRILKYHVVSGRVFSDAVVKMSMAETLAGESVAISVANGSVKINDATVVSADVDAANGVIHVVDAVLLPPEDMSSVEKASTILNLAINRGAPLFNHGQAAATTAIYEVAAHAVLAMDAVPTSAKRALRAGLTEMSSHHGSERQAWAMRYAIDDARAAMSASMATVSH